MPQYSPQFVSDLIERGNLPHADILCRMALERSPGDARYLYQLGRIAMRLGLAGFASQHFHAAMETSPSWAAPRAALDRLMLRQGRPLVDNDLDLMAPPGITGNRFLLVKSWGYGFWSDVDHVLGQLLVAELTQRTPVVHWGHNSHYSDAATANCFDLFFQPVSEFSIRDLLDPELDFFPPKWNADNLLQENLNKASGPWSRVNSISFLARTERVLVSDFYTRILQIRNWIPAGHPLSGLSTNQIYRVLVSKYLVPRPEITQAAESFRAEHLRCPYISVHIRGSDKIRENPVLNAVNSEYAGRIDRMLRRYPAYRIFLLTDDADQLDSYKSIYGDRVVSTRARRSRGSAAVHDTPGTGNGAVRGREVMVDCYIACGGEFFLGNGFSNVSAMIRQLKDWAPGQVELLSQDIHNSYNYVLHAPANRSPTESG